MLLTPQSPRAPVEPPGTPRPSQPQSRKGARSPRRLWWRMGRPTLGAAALLFLMGDDGISREEYLCEAAVLHLAECCPEFPAKELHCVETGCNGNVIPDLREERSMCLQQKSCEDLIASGACDPARWEQVNACERELCNPKVPPC